MADEVKRVYEDVDRTLRASLTGIGKRYEDSPDTAALTAVLCLVPVICSMLDEIGATMPQWAREHWAEHLYKTADRLVAQQEDKDDV